MKQSDQIKIVDYRNASYQGWRLNGLSNKLGAILTEDFLFCLAIWFQGYMHGPCFCIFPSEKIFYGDFINNNPDGLCCYQMGRQCHIYCIYDKGKMRTHLVADFPTIKCVLDLNINEVGTVIQQKQHDYIKSQQKWGIMQKLLNLKIPKFLKGFNNYIRQSFLDKFKQIQEIPGPQHFIGFVGDGLGFKFRPEENQICQVGYYNQNNLLKHLGKKIVNKQKRVRQQGIYNRPQTLIRYQQRPPIVKKTYRDFLRLSINFQNQFLKLPNLQKIQKQLQELKIIIKDSTTQRLAQQLIQHLDQYQFMDNYNNMDDEPSRLSQPANRSKIKERYTNNTRKMDDVTIDQLKQQLNRSTSQKKLRGRSPYQDYNPLPAQLKYTSKTGKKVQPNLNNTKDRSMALHWTQSYEKKYPNNQITKQINFNFDKLLNDQNQYNYQKYNTPSPIKHYPIQNNLRLINNRQISRSPIRPQNKVSRSPRTIKYLDQSNPQYSDRFPRRIHSNFDPNRSNSPIGLGKDYKPRSKERLDKLQKMYDEIQDKNITEYKQNANRNTPIDKGYILNRGKGYHYDYQNEINNKISSTRPLRTVEEPRKSSRSPNRHTNIQNTYKPKQFSTRYERQRQIQRERFNNQKYQMERQERRRNYGYFDKNR